MVFAEVCEISERTAEGIIEKILGFEAEYREMVMEAILPEEMKERMGELIAYRMGVLKR